MHRRLESDSQWFQHLIRKPQGEPSITAGRNGYMQPEFSSQTQLGKVSNPVFLQFGSALISPYAVNEE